MKNTILTTYLAMWLIAFSGQLFALSGVPDDVYCSDPPVVKGGYTTQKCEFKGGRYHPPGYEGKNHPVMFIYPTSGKDLVPTINLQGYASLNYCDTPAAGAEGKLLIRLCASWYPDMVPYYPSMMDWNGPLAGTNSQGWRIASSMEYAAHRWGDILDLDAGYGCEGSSAGATGCLLQAMLMHGFLAQLDVATIHGTRPHVLFIKNQFSRAVAVQNAWRGVDETRADPRKHPDWLEHIYLSMHGGSNDDLGLMDIEAAKLCEDYELACFFTWDMGGHSADGEAGVNFPRGLYQAPYQSVRLDSVLPAITHSTGNNWNPDRGHLNLGFSWVLVKPYYQSTDDRVVMPLRYKRHTNIGGGVPDQPQEVTFDVTLRRVEAAKAGQQWSYSFGNQAGTITAGEDKILRVKDLHLTSSDKYTGLVLELVEESEWAIVYTRQHRVKEEWANFQRFYDVKNVKTHTETTLVLDSLTGKQRIIHSCEHIKKVCSPHDGRVSPDGTRIVYTVARANYLLPVKPLFINLLTDPIQFQAMSYELWVHDIAANTTKMVGEGRMPDWCGNDCLVFASDRAGTYAPMAHHGNEYPHKALQLYKGKLI